MFNQVYKENIEVTTETGLIRCFKQNRQASDICYFYQLVVLYWISKDTWVRFSIYTHMNDHCFDHHGMWCLRKKRSCPTFPDQVCANHKKFKIEVNKRTFTHVICLKLLSTKTNNT